MVGKPVGITFLLLTDVTHSTSVSIQTLKINFDFNFLNYFFESISYELKSAL